MKNSSLVAPIPRLGYSVDEVVVSGALGGRSTIYALIGDGTLETLRVRGRRIVTPEQIAACMAKLKKAAEGAPIVDPEISKKKSAAGKKGRAVQLGEAEIT